MALRKLILALAAIVIVGLDHHHSRCHAAAIVSPITANADSSDHDAAANPVAADTTNATASVANKKQPVCPPLDLLIVNPIDIAFSRDCVLTYLARAFSTDLNPINKKAITYAVTRLERALTAIQMINRQMQACDNAVRSAISPRDVMDPGQMMPPGAQMMLPPGMTMVPRGVPPPPPGAEDGSADDVAPPPAGDGLAPAQTAAIIGQTVVLPPGAAIVIPTQAVSAAAAKQAVLNSNAAKTTPK